jgi:hypothetical protein
MKRNMSRVVAILVCLLTISFAFASTSGNFVSQEKKQEKKTILYIVDGKPMSAKEADKIDTEKIDKMEFIKEPEEIRKYTDEEVDMVVLVTMKKSAEQDSTSKE